VNAARIILTLALLVSRGLVAQDARPIAQNDTTLRIVVSLANRRLLVIDGDHDTLLVAPVAVGSGLSVSYGARRWRFDTPRGTRMVVSKDSAPLWIPPDWHYVEVARQARLHLVWLHGDTTIIFDDGSRLVVDRETARFISDEGTDHFAPGEHIVVDDVLYVPPIGSANRQVPGELGEFRLSIGDGIGIHGTPDKSSVGNAVTHGCMRLSDADIAWLYHRVPVGARVYIY